MTTRASIVFVWVLAILAVAVLVVGTCTVINWPTAPRDDGLPHYKLNILAAVSLRPYVEEVADELEREHYVTIQRHYGASEDLFTRIQFQPKHDPIDIYLPADESYIDKAEKLGYVKEVMPLARMKAVMLIAEGNTAIQNWPTLLHHTRISLANENAAIGQLTREHLRKSGEWVRLEPLLVGTSNVSESANAVKIGASPAAIVWEPVAKNYPNLRTLELPEIKGIEAKIVAARLNDREYAKLFLKWLVNKDLLKKHHFTPITTP
jgi:molybdate transport system substrate-binding protein